MKKVAVIVFIVLFAMPFLAMAEDEEKSTCQQFEKMAELIMKSRQAGISMSEVMGVSKISEIELARKMVIAAYESPRYQTEEMKQRAIEEFKNEAYLQCIKSQE